MTRLRLDATKTHILIRLSTGEPGNRESVEKTHLWMSSSEAPSAGNFI